MIIFTASLRADFDMGGVALTSITGYNNLDVDNAADNDYEARSLRYTTQDIDQKEFFARAAPDVSK